MSQVNAEKHNIKKIIIAILMLCWDTENSYLYTPADPSQVESETVKSN